MNGLIERIDGNEQYYDILIYNRKLSKEELAQYELDYICCEKCKYWKDEVCVNADSIHCEDFRLPYDGCRNFS